jgi:predicted metalloprotease with PDZ domain
LVTPDLHLATPVRFRARNMPRGWSFASDLAHPGLQLGRVWASVTVGGDYRVRRGADRNIRVAIRGDWGFTDEGLVAQVNEIVAGHRRFWGDSSSPYLVTVTQIEQPEPGWLSIGGTGLDDAFAFFATPNAEARPIVRTLAHESLHTWIPGRIGGMPQEGEAAHYWLSEGFTDFYTGRMLVREGLWTPQDFANDLNEMLSAYAQSPVREEPNARILADFWNDADVQRLPYQRGRLLGIIWDARLRSSGRDLDNLVLEMRARALAGDPLKAALMFPIVAESMGLDVEDDIGAHVERGAPILLPEDALAGCGRIETRQAPVFHRGFDIAATQAANNVISGVDPGLPAYAAGMRDGMMLIRRDAGEIGNADREITYVVRDGDAERAITYMPRGRGTYAAQRLVLDAPLEGERLDLCRGVIGGS